jgi:hypothetical protein
VGFNVAAAAVKSGKVVKPDNGENLDGLMEAKSCKTPTVATESCTAGSWKTKSGTTLLRTEMIALVTLPKPAPPGTAMFFAIDPSIEARSGLTSTSQLVRHIQDRRGVYLLLVTPLPGMEPMPTPGTPVDSEGTLVTTAEPVATMGLATTTRLEGLAVALELVATTVEVT